MTKGFWIAAAIVAALSGFSGCGGGGGGGAGDGGGGAGGAAAGTMEFSCTQSAAFLCTQLLIPSSGSTLSTEQSTCVGVENGVSGTGCATVGLVGCCQPKAGDPSMEEQCYYSSDAATTGMLVCNNGHTWSTTM